MELEDFKTVWHEYDKKLDRALQFNATMMRSLTLDKVQSALRRTMFVRVAELVVAVIFALFCGNFVWATAGEWEVALAGAILLTFTIITIVGNVQQLSLLSNVDYAAPVTMLQKQLARIRSHALLYLRIALLQFPLFMVYLVIGAKLITTLNILRTGDTAWLLSQLAVSIAFVPLVVWLWRKLSPANMHIAWVGGMVRSVGGEGLASAMALLNELEVFDSEV